MRTSLLGWSAFSVLCTSLALAAGAAERGPEPLPPIRRLRFECQGIASTVYKGSVCVRGAVQSLDPAEDPAAEIAVDGTLDLDVRVELHGGFGAISEKRPAPIVGYLKGAAGAENVEMLFELGTDGKSDHVIGKLTANLESGQESTLELGIYGGLGLLSLPLSCSSVAQ
jgi:hypothetical protein